MNIRNYALVKAVESFESIGFMEWHARVLRELSITPQSIRDIARKTGLFHYHVQGVILDLLALQLIQYRRNGIRLTGEWDMLDRLVSCCEDSEIDKPFDCGAAFDIVAPKVMALEKKHSGLE